MIQNGGVVTALSALCSQPVPPVTVKNYWVYLATKWAGQRFALTIGCVDVTPQDDAGTQLRAAVYARLSETYDAAESVPIEECRAARGAAGLAGRGAVQG
jgi:hypothetical protein